MYPYRVFVSYAHDDKDLAKRVVAFFEKRGLINLWDHTINPGRPFTTEIKGLISFSHLFTPLITPNSNQKPWVHQETGFAMGAGIPVLPISIGERPDQMIYGIQAPPIGPNLEGLETQVTAERLEQVVMTPSDIAIPVYQTADHPEQRMKLIIDWTQKVLELSKPGCAGRIRQRAPYSLFSIPTQPTEDISWDLREGQSRQHPYYRELMLEMRRKIEQHARTGGCDLLIDPTKPSFLAEGVEARKSRLLTLRAFMESMDDQQLRVVIRPGLDPGYTLLVGDWFLAKSTTPRTGVGWMQTNVTRHAPTVLAELRKFDWFFEASLREQNLPPEQSRRAAIAKVDEILKSIA